MTADKEDAVPIHFEQVAEQMAPATTWRASLFGQTSFMTVEPTNVKALLATQFKEFDLGPRRQGTFGPLFGHGIFSDDGERWERSRHLIRPQFAREQLANIDVLEHHAQHLMRFLKTTEGRTGQVDFVPLFFRYTLDSSTETLFGQSVNSQLAALAQTDKSVKISASDLQWQNFGPAFDKATEQISKRFRLDSLYWLYDTKALRSACAEVHRFADHFVPAHHCHRETRSQCLLDHQEAIRLPPLPRPLYARPH
jgi:cytochrome P450